MDHGTHEEHPASSGHGDHGGQTGHGGHAGYAEMFRDRLWISVAVTIPVLAFSEMIQDWVGFRMPDIPGRELVAPVLGTAVFLYGGCRSSPAPSRKPAPDVRG